MSSPIKAREKKSVVLLKHFLCIKHRRRYGNIFGGKEGVIKEEVEKLPGVELDSVGELDVCIWINGRPVGQSDIVEIRRAVGKGVGMRPCHWYAGYYLTSVGQVSIGEYKSFIAGL